MENTNMQLLNDNHKRFYRLLAQYPRIAQYWDWEKREVDVERITADVPAMSHGEQLLAHFFVSVWLGKSTFGGDVIEAATVLDEKGRVMIANWLIAPFWP
jgi:hypothetical protein